MTNKFRNEPTIVELPVIRMADVPTIVAIAQQIPELTNPYAEAEYYRRFEGVPHLMLAAWLQGQAIGFKAGYEREGQFYSWMGGVLPAFRRLGVAAALAATQEDWARAQGYEWIFFKTRNSHKGMLVFALKNGFNIVGFESKDILSEHRIILQKTLD